LSSLLITSAKIAVTTAGTAVPLGTKQKDIACVYIQATKGNAGPIIVGSSAVLYSLLNGIILEPPSTSTTATQLVLKLENVSLDQVFIDASTNGDSASIFITENAPGSGYHT
jgi:hypothetical protein